MKRLALLVLALLLLPVGAPAQAQDVPASAYISGVQGYAQSYSLSCEARSAVDWAAFWGVAISETDFLFGLPRSDNPEAGFVGEPNDFWGGLPPRGYGVHAEPVAALLRAYGLQAQAHKDLSWTSLQAEIAAGRPVMVWIIGQMWVSRAQDYTAADGSTTRVAPFEHTMIVIGYDANLVHVVDAYSGWTHSYALPTFLASWAVLGNLALTGEGAPQQPSAAQTLSAEAYTVQRGDYLTALGRKFDVSWQEIAMLNNLSYPYTLYPGQLLRLPGGSVTPPPAESQQPAMKRIHLPAVFGRDPLSQAPAAYPEPGVESAAQNAEVLEYVVEQGDYLIAVAERFGLNWLDLAALNGLEYPYLLYAGQVLKLK